MYSPKSESASTSRESGPCNPISSVGHDRIQLWCVSTLGFLSTRRLSPSADMRLETDAQSLLELLDVNERYL